MGISISYRYQGGYLAAAKMMRKCPPLAAFLSEIPVSELVSQTLLRPPKDTARERPLVSLGILGL
jgi:hypothetical protein